LLSPKLINPSGLWRKNKRPGRATGFKLGSATICNEIL